MASIVLIPGDESEIGMCREFTRRMTEDWMLYGQVHLTNARRLTMLDPKGVTYAPTGREFDMAAAKWMAEERQR